MIRFEHPDLLALKAGKLTRQSFFVSFESTIITEFLVRFYNVLIKWRYYVERWKNILDTILKKGKGPILGKLRTIQLIEADMQT